MRSRSRSILNFWAPLPLRHIERRSLKLWILLSIHFGIENSAWNLKYDMLVLYLASTIIMQEGTGKFNLNDFDFAIFSSMILDYALFPNNRFKNDGQWRSVNLRQNKAECDRAQ